MEEGIRAAISRVRTN